MIKFYFGLLLLMVLTVLPLSSQTYQYRRILVVKGTVKKTVNDDAHYLTFNKKGCYESDNKGFAVGSNFARFVKNENNLHCYYGDGYWGKAHYYFSQNYSRLNVKTDEATLVYERVAKLPSSTVRRKYQKSGGGGYIVVPPSSSFGTQPNTSIPSSKARTCPSCGGSGKCKGCGGIGKQGSSSYYTDGHTIISDCPVCNGNGRCGTCRGMGKL